MTFLFRLMWMSLTDGCLFFVVVFFLHMVKVCTSDVSGFQHWCSPGYSLCCFVFFSFLVENSPQTTNNTHFHFGCFVFPLRCLSHVFSIFCSHVPVYLPSVFVTPSLIFTGRTPHVPSPLLCSFPAIYFELDFSLFSLSLISSPCMLSSPALSYQSLTSICSLLILILSFHVEYVCDRLPCAISHSH